MIDAGFFFTLLGIGFVLLIAKIQYREFFQFLSAAIFLILGFQVISGDTMAFLTTIDDGSAMINQSNYIIGGTGTVYGFSSITFGFFLILLGIIGTFTGMLSWFSFKGNEKP